VYDKTNAEARTIAQDKDRTHLHGEDDARPQRGDRGNSTHAGTGRFGKSEGTQDVSEFFSSVSLYALADVAPLTYDVDTHRAPASQRSRAVTGCSPKPHRAAPQGRRGAGGRGMLPRPKAWG